MNWKLTCLVCALLLGGAGRAIAAEATPYELRDVGITEHLGDTIDLDLPFVDESGNAVTLRKYFEGPIPVLVNLVYYECPSLCSLLLNGVTDTLTNMAWTAGKEFRIVSISIDPGEGPDLASAKKASHLEVYDRPEVAGGWHFLTGKEEHIQKLAAQLGFGYRYDADSDEYAHAAAVMVLTPQGKISRYLYGIQFRPRDYKLALLEAAEGKIGTVIDKLLMYCYHYDPQGKKYALFATNLMKAAGGVTVFGVGLMVWGLSRSRNHKG